MEHKEFKDYWYYDNILIIKPDFIYTSFIFRLQ